MTIDLPPFQSSTFLEYHMGLATVSLSPIRNYFTFKFYLSNHLGVFDFYYAYWIFVSFEIVSNERHIIHTYCKIFIKMCRKVLLPIVLFLVETVTLQLKV